MPADALRLFVFARHAESAANAAGLLNSNPSQPVVLTARGRTQARDQPTARRAATSLAALTSSESDR
jgi:broad specificity phosphatase PhoE